MEWHRCKVTLPAGEVLETCPRIAPTGNWYWPGESNPCPTASQAACSLPSSIASMVAHARVDRACGPYEGPVLAGGRAFKIWQRPRGSNSAIGLQRTHWSPDLPHHVSFEGRLPCRPSSLHNLPRHKGDTDTSMPGSATVCRAWPHGRSCDAYRSVVRISSTRHRSLTTVVPSPSISRTTSA